MSRLRGFSYSTATAATLERPLNDLRELSSKPLRVHRDGDLLPAAKTPSAPPAREALQGKAHSSQVSRSSSIPTDGGVVSFLVRDPQHVRALQSPDLTRVISNFLKTSINSFLG